MALSAATQRTITQKDASAYHTVPVKASSVIYKGGAVSLTSAGVANALVAAEAFAGFADQNATGGTANGDVYVRVCTRGIMSGLSITGATGYINLVAPNNDVFMSDDNTFTLTISGNTKVGHIVGYDAAAGTFSIYFEGFGYRSNT